MALRLAIRTLLKTAFVTGELPVAVLSYALWTTPRNRDPTTMVT